MTGARHLLVAILLGGTLWGCSGGGQVQGTASRARATETKTKPPLAGQSAQGKTGAATAGQGTATGAAGGETGPNSAGGAGKVTCEAGMEPVTLAQGQGQEICLAVCTTGKRMATGICPPQCPDGGTFDEATMQCQAAEATAGDGGESESDGNSSDVGGPRSCNPDQEAVTFQGNDLCLPFCPAGATRDGTGCQCPNAEKWNGGDNTCVVECPGDREETKSGRCSLECHASSDPVGDMCVPKCGPTQIRDRASGECVARCNPAREVRDEETQSCVKKILSTVPDETSDVDAKGADGASNAGRSVCKRGLLKGLAIEEGSVIEAVTAKCVVGGDGKRYGADKKPPTTRECKGDNDFVTGIDLEWHEKKGIEVIGIKCHSGTHPARVGSAGSPDGSGTITCPRGEHLIGVHGTKGVNLERLGAICGYWETGKL